MNKTALELLEFNKIKEMLGEYTLSNRGKEMVEKLQPEMELSIIRTALRETSEAKFILGGRGSVPLHSLKGVDQGYEKLGKGMVLRPDEFSALWDFLDNCIRMKIFMLNLKETAPLITSYGASLYQLEDLMEEIERCIRHNRVADKASSTLGKIRKRMAIVEERIKSKIEGLLRSMGAQEFLQEQVISTREGRYVLPVKKEHLRSLQGEVLDRSNSGSTVFIEPQEVKKLQNELNQLKIEEEQEEYKILSLLTGLAEGYQREISINMEVMVNYDFIFAKAKLGRQIQGSNVNLNNEKYINIRGGKHPLIGSNAVPLDFTIGKNYRGLVITGPNTGGKTVALKTVGLLTIMVQSGLLVPVEEGSEFAIFEDVLVDIGDGQSIEQSLSTFSSHLKNLIFILNEVSPRTLVLVDELGAGTDPGEGMGLATAILEELYQKGATILATTHYSEIKTFAVQHDGFINGCMEFDINTLKPLYQLKIGKAGESNGFLIALRLGMRPSLIERAHEITYKESKDYQDMISQLEEISKPQKEDVKEKDQKRETTATTIEKHKEIYKKTEKKTKQMEIANKFKIGDCVHISTLDRTGIVCELANQKGDVGVMVMKKKLKINHKRLTLYIDQEELYPENYDFDIIFESKENRKNKKIISRKLSKGVQVEC
ncbi:endonuclease MutS2 [Alkaliphilus hydrothermalis]|uniref:MutS2 family protein n=1 Tax=Alkaliphilus hydrothermalis TaxID=1482730 RepID=A0ABS2NSU5_9FIRM|nr:hypothetical protein [Alkaliphilus hydrothermalis]MBM7615906.1 MutS2 family protein [Alkaliphilus hydrothermalis]